MLMIFITTVEMKKKTFRIMGNYFLERTNVLHSFLVIFLEEIFHKLKEWDMQHFCRMECL